MSARVLIIEDNFANLELMTYLLSAFGHTVMTAESGLDGLDAAVRELPDLIICDVQLPDIDGFEVARRLQEDLRLASIPRVAVTALAMVGDRDRVLAAGFDGYLAKPIDPETFVPQMQSFLRGGSPPAEAPVAPGRVTILAVEHLPGNLELAREVISRSGYKVITTDSLTEGLALARGNGCHLILSDVPVFTGSGYEFLREVRSDPRLKEIPFLLITSAPMDDRDRENGLSLGATDILRCPIEPEELLAEIAACLAEKGTGRPCRKF